LDKKVYSLITRRFLAIFFPPAVYSKINVTTKVDDERFYTVEKILVDPGYQEILHIKKNNEKASASDVLKNLKKGKEVKIDEINLKEGETNPPRRYTSGSIILAMENAGKLIEDDDLREQIKGSGIGTSATRAEIIKKLNRIKYIKINNKTQLLTPAYLGELIFEVLSDSIKDLLDPRLTASWEKGLKMVANKETTGPVYRTKLEHYIRKKTKDVLDIKNFITIQKKLREVPHETSKNKKDEKSIKPDFVIGTCPACGRGEVLVNSKGYGCNKWKEGCKFFVGNICGVDIPREQVELLLTEGKTKLITGFKAKNGNLFDACLEYQNGRVNFKFIDQMLKDIKISPSS
ncbi:topoisomerase C-terminal repeat-containing protein, partial [bacterium]|nr:topoisomerase C-terminal repeat-containing protein [bacterium]